MIGEEELTEVTESTTLPRSFLGTAVPPQLSVGKCSRVWLTPTLPSLPPRRYSSVQTPPPLPEPIAPGLATRMSPGALLQQTKFPVSVDLLRLLSKYPSNYYWFGHELRNHCKAHHSLAPTIRVSSWPPPTLPSPQSPPTASPGRRPADWQNQEVQGERVDPHRWREERERKKNTRELVRPNQVARPLFRGLSIARIRTKSLNPLFT